MVVGFARTGQAVCDFLLEKEVGRLTVSDRKPESELERVAEYRKRGVEFDCGRHRLELFLAADLIVVSPGVPPLPEILEARDKGVKVISEIELAYHFLNCRLVGITGSNGKSTTTTLIYRMLKNSGLKVHLTGNIGTPLISFVKKSRPDHIIVTEISSFRSRFTENFRTDIAVFLNISPNHLDWHKSYENYIRAKKNSSTTRGPETWPSSTATTPSSGAGAAIKNQISMLSAESIRYPGVATSRTQQSG